MKNKDLICVLMLIAALLTSCGSEGEPAPPTTVPQTPTAAATPTLSAEHHWELGVDYHEQGNVEQAIVQFERAIELDAKESRAHRSLGTVYLEEDRFEESAAAYERAVEIDPDYGEAYGDLTAAYFELGRIEEAVSAGEKALELTPDYATAHNNLGVVYQQQGTLDKAIAEYEKAIELDPSDAGPHANLGIIYKDQGEFDLAIAAFQKAIELDPADAKPHNSLGNVYKNQGELDLAVAEYEKALEIDPEYSTAQASLGLLYAQNDMPDMAIAEFETYLQRWPDGPYSEQIETWLAELESQGPRYVNAAGGYSLPHPAGWYYAENGTRVGLAESQEAYQAPSLVSPLVTLFMTGRAEAAAGLGVAESAPPREFLQVMTQRVKAEVETMEEVEIVGYPAAVAAVSGSTMGAPHRGDMIMIVLEDRVLLVEAVAPPDQWDAFRPTFVDMINGLTFFEPEVAEGLSVDFTDPVSVLQAVFTAARTEDFAALSGLCDPRGENDDDTALICAITAEHPDKDSFVEYFAPARVAGNAAVDGDRAEIPFLFGPDGAQQETMGLVQREGKWYLTDF